MAGKAKTASAETTRENIIDAAMALAAQADWDDVRLSDIAAQAGVSLADLRGAFDSKTAIIHGLMRRIDRTVLDGDDPDMADEPPRDRLFDVLMRRFDALKPFRDALRSVMRAYRRDPVALAQFNLRARSSMKWMLEAAQIDATGRMGSARAQGLVIVWARTLPVFLRDDDSGLARTMAALDRNLRDGERFMRSVSGGLRLVKMAGTLLSEMRDRGRRYRDDRGRHDRDEDRSDGDFYGAADKPGEPYTGGPH